MSANGLSRTSGETIGPWRLVEPIGRGGFSEVWRAEPLAHGRAGEVALKLIVHDEHAAQLRAEARALALVSGRGIVRVLDLDLEHDPPWLALERFQGDLRARLAATGGRLPAAAAISLVERILDVLGRVHDEGVVHGDLKPENVLFDVRGHLALADFGLSRRLLARSASLSHSLSRGDARIAGTIDYMAPEQRDGAPPTPRSDVYATGVVFHELLSGAPPQGACALPGELDDRVPPAADRTLARALAPDPRDRFENARAMLDFLRAELARDGRDLDPTRKRAAARLEQVALIPRVWVVLLAVAALAILGHEGVSPSRRTLGLLAGAGAAAAVLVASSRWLGRQRQGLARSVVRIEERSRTLKEWMRAGL